jgi:hypothetical protein
MGVPRNPAGGLYKNFSAVTCDSCRCKTFDKLTDEGLCGKCYHKRYVQEDEVEELYF